MSKPRFSAALAAMALLSLSAVCLPAASDGPLVPTPATATPASVELYFELKLLIRGRWLMQRVALDQWAGGRLRMEAAASAGGSRELRLARPLEDPWTFRWYPTRHDAKLGAAVWVAEPAGHPYGALAQRLLPEARERYARWWDDDRVVSTSPESPAWGREADRFWAEQHRAETEDKDPLHEHPVYPFHVLGDPRGRLRFAVKSNGAVDPESIVERMTEPWLPTGWSDWVSGNRRPGYGFWERERPDWEPRTYETFARLLGLLSWPCLTDDAAAADGRPYLRSTGASGPDFLGAVESVVATLVPRAAGRLSLTGSPAVPFAVTDASSESLSVTGGFDDLDVGDGRADPDVRVRLWRHARIDKASATLDRDELQLLITRSGRRKVKLWLKIGYRPYVVCGVDGDPVGDDDLENEGGESPPRSRNAGNVSMKARISSRTRR